MRLAIIIDREGFAFSSYPVTDKAVGVWCTPEAAARLRVQMRQAGAMCSRCSTIARSAQLVALESGELVCAPGLGCDVDVDKNLFTPESLADYAARDTIWQTLWQTFVRKIPRRDEPVPDFPAPETDNTEW